MYSFSVPLNWDNIRLCVKYEFSDIKSLYTKYDSERRLSVSL